MILFTPRLFPFDHCAWMRLALVGALKNDEKNSFWFLSIISHTANPFRWLRAYFEIPSCFLIIFVHLQCIFHFGQSPSSRVCTTPFRCVLTAAWIWYVNYALRVSDRYASIWVVVVIKTWILSSQHGEYVVKIATYAIFLLLDELQAADCRKIMQSFDAFHS